MVKKSLKKVISPLALGLTLSFLTLNGLTGCSSQPSFEENKTYTVRRGDTLWEIVTEDPYYNNYNPQKVIWDIRKENEIDNPALIRPGQEIDMPKYKERFW